ncbi:hypothetical protein M0812_13434 [Anaeramoeba flamelloides]|uniref:Uncharacterized protein n=1 Tax=Anaeramoeba flamelloides TaxID=1746091 RepID=A0AAV7ZLV5_9EUKA|nr:hypothetical protein M0812_13434 [Anaeramoeba flamelloides]
MHTNRNQTNTGTYNYKQTKLVDLLSLSHRKDFFSQPYQFYVSLEDINFENESVANRSIWISKKKEYSPNSDIVAIILHSSTYLPEQFETNKKKKGNGKGPGKRKGKGKTVIDQNGKKKKKKSITKLKLKPKQMAKELEKEKKRLLERPLGILISFKFLKSIPSSYVMHRKNGIRSRYSSKPTQYPVIIERSQLVLKKSLIPKTFQVVKSSEFEKMNQTNNRKRIFETEQNSSTGYNENMENSKIRKTLSKTNKPTNTTYQPPKDKQTTTPQLSEFSKKCSHHYNSNNNDNSFNITLENVDTKFVNIQQPCVINGLSHQENYKQNLKTEEMDYDSESKILKTKPQNIEQQNEKEKYFPILKTEFLTDRKDTKKTPIVNNEKNMRQGFQNNLPNHNNFFSENYFSPKKVLSKNISSLQYQDICFNITNNFPDYDYDFNFNSSRFFDEPFYDCYDDISLNNLQVLFNY